MLHGSEKCFFSSSASAAGFYAIFDNIFSIKIDCFGFSGSRPASLAWAVLTRASLRSAPSLALRTFWLDSFVERSLPKDLSSIVFYSVRARGLYGSTYGLRTVLLTGIWNGETRCKLTFCHFSSRAACNFYLSTSGEINYRLGLPINLAILRSSEFIAACFFWLNESFSTIWPSSSISALCSSTMASRSIGGPSGS